MSIILKRFFKSKKDPWKIKSYSREVVKVKIYIISNIY